jgi:hypothetical protein
MGRDGTGSKPARYYAGAVAAIVLIVFLSPFVAVVAVPEAIAALLNRSLLDYLPDGVGDRAAIVGAFTVFRLFGYVVVLGGAVYLVLLVPFGLLKLHGGPFAQTSTGSNPLGLLFALLGLGVVVLIVLAIVYRYLV